MQIVSELLMDNPQISHHMARHVVGFTLPRLPIGCQSCRLLPAQAELGRKRYKKAKAHPTQVPRCVVTTALTWDLELLLCLCPRRKSMSEL